MKYFVYVLSSKTKLYNYTGLTNNIQRRLAEHNSGYNRTTKPYRPFDIIHVEEYDNRLEARIREKYLKSGTGREWIKSL